MPIEEQGATLLPASVTTAPKEEPEPTPAEVKKADDLDVSAVFAKLKQLGGKARVIRLLPACGEKVGMRGPLRWAQNRGNAPSPSFASLTRPLPARRGEVFLHPRSFRSTTQAPPAAISLLQKLSR